MVSANKDMVAYCFDTLLAHYTTDQPPPPAFDDGQQLLRLRLLGGRHKDRSDHFLVPVMRNGRFELDTFSLEKSPLFVTWKKVMNGAEPRLRGCIGTLEARGLINGFRDYALNSALKDRRFPPIQAKEIPYLECTVSILTDYETASNYLDWEIGKHGIIIEFTDPDYNTRRSATYLPEIAAHEGWTKTEAIDSLMRKSGYNGNITESLRNRIRLTRYQSSLCTMDHNDYVSYVKETRGGAPCVVGVNSGSR